VDCTPGRIDLDVGVGVDAAFHMTRQTATVVHDGCNDGAIQSQRVTVKRMASAP